MFNKIALHSLIALVGFLVGMTALLALLAHGPWSPWSWNRQSSVEAAFLRSYGPALSRLGLIQVHIMKAGKGLPHYRETLLSLSDELSGMKRDTELRELQPAVSMSLGYAYLGLARLEREQGRGEQAGAFMAKARQEFESIGWQDSSDSSLNAALNREIQTWRCCTKEAHP